MFLGYYKYISLRQDFVSDGEKNKICSVEIHLITCLVILLALNCIKPSTCIVYHIRSLLGVRKGTMLQLINEN